MRWSSSPCKVNFNSKPKVVASEQDEEEDDVEDEGKYNEDYYHYTTVTPTIRSPAFMATFTQQPMTSSSTKPAEPVPQCTRAGEIQSPYLLIPQRSQQDLL